MMKIKKVIHAILEINPNAKVIVKEAIEPGVYDVACWMGETEKGKYMKITVDPQTHLTTQDKKSEINDDMPF